MNKENEIRNINRNKKDNDKNREYKKKAVNNKKTGRRMKKKKSNKRALKVFLGIILIILLIIGIFLTYSTIKNGWGVQALLQTAMGQDKNTLEKLDPLTVLIMGVSKDIDSELTDTIMVASYNPKQQKATLLSIPRDTFVGTNKNKATSWDKINALYQKSPKKTLDAVNKITGLDIKYYVVIDNKALVQLVDEIGGVDFDVPIDMDYDDVTQDLYIHLSKGYQRLNGDQAEQLVRFRKNNDNTSYPSSYGDNDIGRMRTQREFLKAVASQTIKFQNITKIGSFIDIFKENVKTNITDWNYIKKYIPYTVSFSTDNLETASLPGTTDVYNKLWFFIYNKKETEKLVNDIFYNNDEAVTEDENSINSLEENTINEINEKSNKINSNSTSVNKNVTTNKKINKGAK